MVKTMITIPGVSRIIKAFELRKRNLFCFLHLGSASVNENKEINFVSVTIVTQWIMLKITHSARIKISNSFVLFCLVPFHDSSRHTRQKKISKDLWTYLACSHSPNTHLLYHICRPNLWDSKLNSEIFKFSTFFFLYMIYFNYLLHHPTPLVRRHLTRPRHHTF